MGEPDRYYLRPIRMRTRQLLLATAVTLTLLTGCGAQQGTGDSTPTDGGSASSILPTPGATTPGVTPTQPAQPPSGGLSLPPTGKSSPGAQVTVTGTVEAGVEASCLLLRTGSVSYLLLGGDPAVVKAGARVRVTGVVRTDIMTYCMQGVPLQVTAASPA